MKLLTTLLIFAAFSGDPTTPDTLNLQYCYDRISEHYPVAQKVELQRQITSLNTQIANTGYYPDIELGAQASYQSEVTEIKLPGSTSAPTVSKDQYEASVSVTQNIFRGGAVGVRKKLEQIEGKQLMQETQVEMHQIRSQVDQVYYGILLSEQQQKVNALLIENLDEQLASIRTKVENGVLLPSQENILEAELIKAKQDSATIQATVRAGYRVLGKLIGQEITKETTLVLPQVRVDLQSLQPQRVEYKLFETSLKALNARKELAGTKKLPAISAFGSAGYGRPGYNFLNDDFHDYYMVGLQLQWNLMDFINSGREMQALQIKQKKVQQNKKAFSRQLNGTLDKLAEIISTVRENIKRDKQIISLREQVVKESASKLENGTITATDYVTELNQANRAKLSLFINRVKLSESRARYATELGVPLK